MNPLSFPESCSKRYLANILCVLCATVLSHSSLSTGWVRHSHIEDRNESTSVYIMHSNFGISRESTSILLS